MRRYLVVANQTLGGEPLAEQLRSRMTDDGARFSIVVPATPSQEGLTWQEGEAVAVARERLDLALARFRALGADVDGEVGDGNPILAIEDALSGGSFDEIILSTLPPGISRWLRLDLPSRVGHHFRLPVTHVIAQPEAA